MSEAAPTLDEGAKHFVRLAGMQALTMPGDVHDTVRCQRVAAFVLGLWQFSGGIFTNHPPSFLLVNGGSGDDPVLNRVFSILKYDIPLSERLPDEALDWFTRGRRRNEAVDEDEVRSDMREILARAAEFRKRFGDDGAKLFLNDCIKEWVDAQAKLYPLSHSIRYAQAWDPEFGLMTGTEDFTSLLIRNKEDSDALASDLASKSPFSTRLRGHSIDCRPTSKRASVLGSLPAFTWSHRWIEGVLYQEDLPLLFLPHCGGDYVPLPLDDEELTTFAIKFVAQRRADPNRSLLESHRVKMTKLGAPYEELLRKRLAEFPGDFAFMVLKVIRDLQHVIARIVLDAFPVKALSSTPAVMDLVKHLYIATLRGITYGIEALAYHGFGISLGKDRPDASTMLEFIRRRGEVRRRDIQVKYPRLKAVRRDRILARLAEEDLVRMDGRTVRPVDFNSFLTALPSRRAFPSPHIPLQRHQ